MVMVREAKSIFMVTKNVTVKCVFQNPQESADEEEEKEPEDSGNFFFSNKRNLWEPGIGRTTSLSKSVHFYIEIPPS